VRRCNIERFPYGVWYRVEDDGSIVIACLHHKRSPRVVGRRARNPKPGKSSRGHPRS
jgi:hypothetical protein